MSAHSQRQQKYLKKGAGDRILPPQEFRAARQGLHNRKDNADAHIKRQIMGREVVALTKGKLNLDPREQIFYGEFHDRRRKQVLVKIIGK